MWLVTGGAGYIGAHVVRRLRAAGYAVAVLDDLSTGRADRVPPGVPLVVAHVADRRTVHAALRRYGVTGVLHLAARKSAPESVARPAYYHRENVGGLSALLAAMAQAGVHRLVFSSSAAVYGVPGPLPVDEDAPTVPVNPYGHTKLAGERLIRAAGYRDGLDWVALRYFNVVGAAGATLADRGHTNLVPLVFDALARGRPVVVAGVDHPTRDGTGVRDYVHVADIADAHAVAVAALAGGGLAGGGLAGGGLRRRYNVGTGRGRSVLDVLRTVEAVTGHPVPYRIGPRRPADPPQVVADPGRIRRELGWQARYDLADMVESAWSAWCDASHAASPVPA